MWPFGNCLQSSGRIWLKQRSNFNSVNQRQTMGAVLFGELFAMGSGDLFAVVVSLAIVPLVEVEG